MMDNSGSSAYYCPTLSNNPRMADDNANEKATTACRPSPSSSQCQHPQCPYAAAFLTVSPGIVYELFKNGEVPARKIGRKWITTKTALLRWIEESCLSDASERALKKGAQAALTKAFKSGAVRVKGRA